MVKKYPGQEILFFVYEPDEEETRFGRILGTIGERTDVEVDVLGEQMKARITKGSSPLEKGIYCWRGTIVDSMAETSLGREIQTRFQGTLRPAILADLVRHEYISEVPDDDLVGSLQEYLEYRRQWMKQFSNEHLRTGFEATGYVPAIEDVADWLENWLAGVSHD